MKQCNVSVAGSSVTTVTSGTTQVACDAGGHYGTTPFTFSACTGSPISGTCACATGYNGTNCNGCDTANNYVPSGGNCVPGCNVTASNGVTSPTTVVVGSSTLTCNDTANGYSGNMAYTCASNGTFTINTPCTVQKCTGGSTTQYTVAGSTIHVFNANGSLVCNQAVTAQVLLVGGGGSGGFFVGGGGGGGVVYKASHSLAAGTYPVTVGLGGESSSNSNNPGGNTTFSTMTAYGGGSGGSVSGGSGSGAARDQSSATAGGAATKGIADGGTAYGNVGGGGSCGGWGGAGGGGGAGGAGGVGICGSSSSERAGVGGLGIGIGISGSTLYYGGGGGGSNHGNATVAAGGSGVGGNGGQSATSGQPNRGGGGGSYTTVSPSGAGGSGVVIVRYPN